MSAAEKSYRKLDQSDEEELMQNAGGSIGAIAGGARPSGSVLDFV